MLVEGAAAGSKELEFVGRGIGGFNLVVTIVHQMTEKDNKFTFGDLLHITVAVVEVFRPEVGAADLGLSLFLGKENSLGDFVEDFYDSQVFGVYVPGYK